MHMPQNINAQLLLLQMARKSGSTPVLRSVVVFFGNKEYTIQLSKGENLANHRMAKQLLSQIRSDHLKEIEGGQTKHKHQPLITQEPCETHVVENSGNIWDDFFQSEENALIGATRGNLMTDDLFFVDIW